MEQNLRDKYGDDVFGSKKKDDQARDFDTDVYKAKLDAERAMAMARVSGGGATPIDYLRLLPTIGRYFFGPYPETGDDQSTDTTSDDKTPVNTIDTTPGEGPTAPEVDPTKKMVPDEERNNS